MEKMFSLFSRVQTGFCKSLIYPVSLLVIWFVDLIGQSQSTIDGDGLKVYPIIC